MSNEAREVVKTLEEGDIIRIPQYKNELEVVKTSELNGEQNAYIGVEFVRNPTRATKTLIVNINSGRVYLVAGTSDKGEVTTIDVKGR